MIGTPSTFHELLAECDSLGIRLLPTGDIHLTIDAPDGTLTPNLMGRLRAHKADVLSLLRSRLAAPPAPAVATTEAGAVRCRCGSTSWEDVPIHNGQSMRRDCVRCGRFIGFPVWYGTATRVNDQ
jgi:hypothetical protein